MEVAGLALESLSLIRTSMRSFVSITEDTNRSENGILLMRLRLERAKLETTAQLLSWFDPTDSRAYAMHKTAHSLMENLAECLSILDHHRKLPSRNSLDIKLTPVGTEELQVVVMKVSVLNDYLLKVVQSDQELDLEQIDQIAIFNGTQHTSQRRSHLETHRNKP